MPDRCVVDPGRDCLGLIRAQELEDSLRALDERNGKDHREFREKIVEVEKEAIKQSGQFAMILQTLGEIKESNTDMVVALNALKPKADAVDGLEEDVKKLDAEMDEMKSKPAKRWENAVGQVIGIVIAAVVGYILAMVGLG